MYISSSSEVDNISVLSWNVHGNFALKARTPWFQEELSRWDLLLFQETHLRPGQESQIPLPLGFDCLALARPETSNMAHQQGGLLAVFWSLLPVVNITPPMETEVMLLQVADTVVVNVYLPPVSSPWDPDPSRTPVQRLTELIIPATLHANPFILLVGDFNARIGLRSISLPRSSPDPAPLTERGNRLLDLCADLDFEVVSGTDYQTADSRMRFTSFQHNGMAVVDLVFASTALLDDYRLQDMTVHLPRLQWSDHAPLALSMSVPHSTMSMPQPSGTPPPPHVSNPPLSAIDHALVHAMRSHTLPRGSLEDIYGCVASNGSPCAVWLAGTGAETVDSSHPVAGVAIYFFPGCHRNRILHVPGEGTSTRAVLYALATLLVDTAPSTTLRVYTHAVFVIQSICFWAPRNAASQWKVRNGDLLLAVARLVHTRSAPVAFCPQPLQDPEGPHPHLHAAMNLAQTAVTLPCPPHSVFQVPDAWPPAPTASPPGLQHLSKVFTSLRRERAPPREPLRLPAPLHNDSALGGEHHTPLLTGLRNANLQRILASASDHEFWDTLRDFTADKPRPALVTAQALRAVFERRMNPPAVLPSSFDHLQHALTRLQLSAMPAQTQDQTQGAYFSCPFTVEDVEAVKQHIRNTARSSCPGLDNIAYDTVLAVPSDRLRDLFQQCITDHSIPQTWLTAAVAAVKKPRKNASDPESYRTIGLESCLLKTLTLLIDRRLRDWAEHTGLIPDAQSGFRRHHRAINSVFILRTLIDKARKMHRPLYVVYLDLSNAYPSVDQPSLWTKLAGMGAQGPLIDWLRLLYSSLAYVVRFNGETTECFNALAGILTGDPASPILWVLFLADLRVHPHPDDVILDGVPVSLLLVADDILLASTSPHGMQAKLHDIERYCAMNFLTVNVIKTIACFFGQLPHTLPTLTLSGQRLQFKENATYIGVTLASTANDIFVPHYTQKAQAACKIANAAFSLESYVGPLQPAIVRSLYRARVDPHLTYGCKVALDVRPASVQALEKVQHAVFRRLLGLGSRSQLVPLFSETGLWPIRYRRLDLAIRYATYLLRDRPLLALAALKEAYALASVGAMSWVSDLHHAVQALPSPLTFLLPLEGHGLGEHDFLDLRARLSGSLAQWIANEVLHSSRLPLLQWRFRPLMSHPGNALDLGQLCTWRNYLGVPNLSHRRSIARLIASEHPFAVEVLRRMQPSVPRHWRVCRFCQRQRVVETEAHVLLECPFPLLATLRMVFLDDAAAVLGPVLHNVSRKWSSGQLLDFLLSRDKLCTRFAQYVTDVCEFVDTVPVLQVLDDAQYSALAR